MSDDILLAVQNTQVLVPEETWLGNLGPGGIGIIMIGMTILVARGRLGTVGVWCTQRIDGWEQRRQEKAAKADRTAFPFDWRSTFSALFGFLGTTAILGTNGSMSSIAQWGQDLLLLLGDVWIISDLGMGGVSLLLLFLVFQNKDDPISDLRWGCVIAIAFPLGGGVFANASEWAANFLTNMLNGWAS